MKGQPIFAAAFALLLPSLSASAAVVVTQQAAPAPTYSITLNFDEVGGPPGGANAPVNSWSSSHGITIANSGAGGGVFVGNQSGAFPWLPNNNVAAGAFGLFFTFATDLTEISFQAWDPSGPPNPPLGGGLRIALLNNGVVVHNQVYTPAWNGVGNTWFNITTNGGTVFDDVRVLGIAQPGPTSYIDNISWNTVPGPGALAMLGLAGIMGARRQRRGGH